MDAPDAAGATARTHRPPRPEAAKAADRPTLPSPPTATYRLQLQPGYGFAEVAEAVPYLARLGVSHLHLSPVLDAVPGSRHGYDVVGHGRVRAELGGERGLRSLAETTAAHGLGLVLDVVPNHMALPADLRLNRPLWEVLRQGPDSPYAAWFDVDWSAGGGRLVLPVLDGPPERELPRMKPESGTLRYGDRVLPLAPGTENLPPGELLAAQHYRPVSWRDADSELNYRRFFTVWELVGLRVEHPAVFDASHATVVRLVRDGALQGLRIDHPDGLAEPAAYLHRLQERTGGCWTVVEKILADGEELPESWPVAGTTGYDALRQIDGVLTDPAGHAELTAHHAWFTGAQPDVGGAWATTVERAAREVLAEGLVAERERLVRRAAAACVEAGVPPVAPGGARDDGEGDAPDRAQDGSGSDTIARAPETSDGARSTQLSYASGTLGWPPTALRAALVELLVRLPIYRPYACPGTAPRTDDAAYLESAAHAARTVLPCHAGGAALGPLRDLALGRLGDGPRRRAFAAGFAQLSSALRAKSVEDRAGYRHAPLLSACEVGGEPGAPAVPPERFHTYCGRRQQRWPAAGTVLSTHDTKRSADVRATLTVLAECPDRWAEFLDAHAAPRPSPPPPDGRAPRPHSPDTPSPPPATNAAREDEKKVTAPDPGLVWAAWQTAFGLGRQSNEAPGHRSYLERLTDTLLKSAREASLHTCWAAPDEAYEEGVRGLATEVAAHAAEPTGHLAALLAQLAPHIRAHVLGGTLLQLTMPGVPELYQGTERLYRALVDPDNRPPVPPGMHTLQALRAAEARPGPVQQLPEPENELAVEKLRLTTSALRLRARRPALFAPHTGTYTPLRAHGPAAAHCLAFVRGGAALTVVTRLSLRLHDAGGWRTTHLPLPEGTWRRLDASTEADAAPTGPPLAGHVPLQELLADGPVSLLVRE